ncbi:PREDICTED: glycogen-binding subunit 76A isoform X2 [Trachymyrmex cornetzi]|uniref:glycogen-binding subunit 76A isoform X2 n=1 Tax=Trachymyrmex cornetzi TaxID=471704 RepID=UPI00084F5A75|nr:PREDICTED: glycogen-binding subunit 76A isoform X2 [Trachymyrmex cornetzi]XP_018369619.1 PREDICTED: glycogen-binding subunit 76A isoform X2 [Trachymyrmex cornetzi]
MSMHENGNSASVPAGRDNDSTSPLPLEGRHAEETASSTVLKMGSMDSAGNARGPSCGLVSSLLPSNCRGSAEAFARCLHRRLKSLGNENGSPERTADAAKPCETSWLHPSSSSRHVIANNQHPTSSILQHPTSSILQHQPRHSSESDLFYDIEVEEAEMDGPGSPPEEATAAELAHMLVNPEILKASHHDACHCSPSGTKMTSAVTSVRQDPESCVFASPITGTPPDSDSSEMFFDPESSDADKSRAEIYFDPISTSDSEVMNLSNTSVPARTKLALNGRKRANMNLERCDDTTSESSCSSRRNPTSCENRQEGLICSSEDSLNGRSSQETTSPSHESLWSTFDDSTVSLQDESPLRTIQDSVIPRICLPKSHSDSELPNNGIGTTVVFNKLDRRDEEEEENVDEHEIDEIDAVNGISQNVTCNIRNGSLFTTQDVENDRDLTKDDSFNGAEDLINMIEDKNKEKLDSETISLNNSSQLKVEEVASDTDTDHSSYSSTIDISDAFTLECSNDATVIEEISRDEMKLKIEKDIALNDSDEEKLCLLLKKLGNSSTAKDEDSSPEQETQSETVEEEEDRPQRVRRCSSLKTGKTPPGTPHRKKIVRFADKLGLDLADVRTFLDEIPKIPNSAYSDLIYDDIFRPQDSNSDNTTSISDDWCDRYQNDGRRRSTSAIPRKIDRMLVPLFQQPGGMPNFLDMVRERRVCLENVVVQDPVTLAIQGTVRVINLDFHKSVHVRYTLNSWRNFSDLQATYVPNSCDGFSDKFSFILYCHTLPVGQRLEFAVRFQCKGAQHWDNNAGANYCFQCLPASSTTGYIPITIDECRRGSWSPIFY